MLFGIELSWGIHFDFYQCACQSLAVFHIRHNCFVPCPYMMVLLPCWSAFTLVTTFRTQVCQGQKCFGVCFMILFYMFTNLHVSHNLVLDRVCFHLSATQICDNGAVVTWKKSQPYRRLRSVTGAAVPQKHWRAESPTEQKGRGTRQEGSAESRVIRDVPEAAARERVCREPSGQRVIQSRNGKAQRAEWSACQQQQKRKRGEAADEPTRPGASGQEWERQQCPPTQHHSGLGR